MGDVKLLKRSLFIPGIRTENSEGVVDFSGKVKGFNVIVPQDTSFRGQDSFGNSMIACYSFAKFNELNIARPGFDILEASSASGGPFGKSLSALETSLDNLKLEIIYHTSKRYDNGAPNLYVVNNGSQVLTLGGIKSRGRKEAGRLGAMAGFEYADEFWELNTPKSAFYDYIYTKAFIATFTKGSYPPFFDETLAKLTTYVGFTDTFFNPDKGFACQARSIALIVRLYKEGLLHSNYTKDSWLDIYKTFVETDDEFQANVDVAKVMN